MIRILINNKLSWNAYIFLLLLFSHSVVSSSFTTPWTVAHQAPLSMAFSRQEYWNGLLFPSSGDLANPRIKPSSPALADRFFPAKPSGNPCIYPAAAAAKSLQSCPTLCDPIDSSPPGSSVGGPKYIFSSLSVYFERFFSLSFLHKYKVVRENVCIVKCTALWIFTNGTKCVIITQIKKRMYPVSHEPPAFAPFHSLSSESH